MLKYYVKEKPKMQNLVQFGELVKGFRKLGLPKLSPHNENVGLLIYILYGLKNGSKIFFKMFITVLVYYNSSGSLAVSRFN